MNQKLQNILDIIQQSEKLEAEQKNNLTEAVKDADKELEITSFKLERTEKVKKTTAILLEETIEELEQKRKAVEAHNRELEIEASLERVRAIAMSMMKSEDLLSICEIFFKEFKKLGFDDLRNSLINIFNDEEESFVNYDYSDYMGGSISNVSYNSNPANDEFLIKIRKANDAFVETVIDRNKLDEWKEFRRSHGEQDDPRLDNITTLYYYNYSIGSGSIGISYFNPISEEQQIILKRFRNVFNLSYQRYLDIVLAEEQARESQIEASLERVRAVAMSMNKSDDLMRICEISFKEFQKLGFGNIRNAIIHILNDEKRFFLDYDYSDYLGGSINNINYNSHPVVEDYLRQIKRADDAFAQVVIEGNELDGWKEFRRSGGQLDDPRLDETRALFYYLHSIGVGDIGISTFKPIDDSQIKIIQRFRNVFDLAYRRHTDITEAEAQAREAEIELALERVRARTMAMQRSEELKEVIQVVYEQFVHLNIHIEHTGFIMDYKARDDMHIWLADKHEVPTEVTIPYFDCAHWNSFNEAKEKGIDFFANHLTFEEKNKFYQDLFKNIPGLPEETLEYYFSCPGLAISTVLLENVGLYIENFSGIPYSDEENNTLMRFGKVFQQTYTRFNDLKQAEAQAREAKVEAALERVRSLALGMRKSEDVGNVTDQFFTELTELSVDVKGCSIVVIDEDNDKMELWRARSNIAVKPFDSNSFAESMDLLKKHMPDWFPTFTTALGKRKNYLIDELSAKRRSQFINVIAEQYKYSSVEKSQLLKNAPEKITTHYIFFKLGYLGLLAEKKLSDENLSVAQRFVEVFDFAYTRFLDIKKAEAQAREAQIEAALERVRSKTMAMHKSEELSKTAKVFFEQMHALGELPDRIGINIIKEDEKLFEIWATNQDGSILDHRFRATIEEPTSYSKLYAAWKAKKDYIIIDLKGQELKKWIKFVRKEIKMTVDDKNIKGRRIHNAAFFSNGVLLCTTHEPVKDDVIKLLVRFAKVFEQTYTRFLDLLKAEAQAREAQIEMALERVRSRTMAMQKSDELAETAYVLYEQFGLLGENPEQLTIGIIDETHKIWEFWLTLGGNQINHVFKASIDEPIVLNKSYIAWKERKKSIVIDISGDELKAYYNFFKNLPGYKEFNDFKNNQIPEHRRVINMAFFSNGSLSLSSPEPKPAETIQLLERFAGVLEQTYTRFLDLQKAEAQAREAQIEAALERVRSRAMAIRKSDELDEVIQIIFQELGSLGIDLMECSIAAYDTNPKDLIYWSAGPIGSAQPSSVKLQYIDHPLLVDLFNDFESGVQYRSGEFSGEFLKTWWDRIFTETDFKYAPVEFIESWKKIKNIFYSQFAMKHGFLEFLGQTALPDDKVDIFKRFTNVVDLTYTRYDDVVKAEAQAREAEIELALERIRAKTMAMQSSNELKEVVANMFDGIKSLGVDPTVCNIALIDKKTRDTEVWTAHHTDSVLLTYKIFIPHFEHPFRENLLNSFLNEIPFSTHQLSDDSKKSYAEYLLEHVDYSNVPDEIIKSNENLAITEDRIVLSAAYMKYGLLIISRSSAISNDESDILQRFAKVFEQTYTRFLDLQKAEAQAREAQIEAALERVRSRSIGMQKSEELKEVIQVIHDQLIHLNFKIDAAGFTMDYYQNNDWNIWIANKNQSLPSQIYIPYIDHPQFNYYKGAKEKGLDFFANTLSFEDKNSIFSYMFEFMGDYSQAEKDYVLNSPGLAISQAFLKNITLWIYNLDGNPYTEEDNTILMRFAKVFEQTYVRFNDLKQAETQAREAQIEAALERVRSKTMAMHNSQDVGATVVTLFDEVLKLGLDKSIRVGIGILEGNEGMETWSATSTPDGEVDLKMGMLDMTIHPMLTGLKKAWESGKTCYSYDYIRDDVFRYYEALNNEPEYPFQADLNTLPENEYHKSFFYTEGILFSFAPNPISDEAAKVLDRFAGVFGQTYRRYLDLQKAEEQAREAQIEAALERVRSKAMAMHSSEDLGLTVDTFFAELKSLNVSPHRCGVGIIDDETRIVRIRAIDTNQNNEIKKIVGDLKLAGHPVLDKIFESWVKQAEYYPVLRGKEIMEYYKVMNPQVKFHEFADDEVQYGYYFYFKEGGVFAWTDNELQERDIEIFRRYTSVLSLTYRRYLDLKDAEAQAQEAKIEASLERVRSKAMAMHSSEDLSATVNVFFKELKTLEIAPIRCGVGQIDEETRTTNLTTTTSSQQGDSFEVIGKIKQTGHPVLDGIYKHWELQKEYHPVLEGADIKAFYNVMNAQIAYPDYSEHTTQFGNLFPFKEGFVFAWTESKLTDEELLIFRRFTFVLSLTYRRYIDLKEAEARSVEAVRQASLDRVRAEIASMRTTNDLEKITPLIWRELTTLGVPFFRCGVFIIDEPNYVAHAYLSTPLGKSLAALHVKINNTWLENAVKHWRNGEIYHEIWDRNKFLSWTQTMMEQGFVENKEHFQAGKEAPETLSLQLLPFTQGMLYVGSKLPLSNEEIKIAEKLANDFGVAYSRYEDFQKLEAVNHRKTLELEEARQLQLSMLPKELPKLPNLDIAVYMKTATEVGGDYYDFNVGVDGTLTVAIGDATGHGMKAGTIVSMIKALFASGGSRMDMKSYFKESSDALKGIELGRLMMAFLMLKIKSNTLEFANAGMPPLFIYRNRLKEVEEMMIHGMPLGAVKDFPYKISEVEISSGDTILLLSDGLPELKNEKNQQYGYIQIKEKFKLAAEKSPNEIVEYLKNSAAEWVNGVEPDDDVTFVIIKIK